MIHRQANTGDEHSHRGEGLRKSLSAEFSRDASGEQHRGCARDCSKQSDGLQRIAEKHALDSYD